MKIQTAIIIVLVIAIVYLRNSTKTKTVTDPQFFYSKYLEWDNKIKNGTGGDQFDRGERFIVRCSDKYSKIELIDFIKKYEKKIDTDTAYISTRYDHFVRQYYKESKKTPIDFIDDGGGFDSDKLEDHDEDFLYSIEMFRKQDEYLGKEIIEWTTKKAE